MGFNNFYLLLYFIIFFFYLGTTYSLAGFDLVTLATVAGGDNTPRPRRQGCFYFIPLKGIN
jgi:hypothetical protein